MLRIGTRASPLAMVQAEIVVEKLRARGAACEIVPVRTKGDRIRSAALVRRGGGVFVKELEDALRQGRIDAAVHSLKDMPTETGGDLCVAAVLERGDPRDALALRDGLRPEGLGPGIVIGTSSLRRAAFLRALYPGVEVRAMRGNVNTRIERVRAGFDGVVLAMAGLERLYRGRPPVAVYPVAIEKLPPAPGQGAIAVQTRLDDRRALEGLDHEATRRAVTAERLALRYLGGGCNAPVAAYGQVRGRVIELSVWAADAAGSVVTGTARGEDPDRVAREAAELVLCRAGREILGGRGST